MKLLCLLLLTMFSYPAWSCSCSSPDLISRIENADKIVVGKVVSVQDREYLKEEYTGANVLKGKVVVQETLKGESEKELILYTGFGQGDCGLGFQTLDTYVFFLSSSNIVSGCQGHIFDATYRYRNTCLPSDEEMFGLPTYEEQLAEVRRLIATGI